MMKSNDIPLEAVENFQNLDSIVSSDGGKTIDISKRTNKARGVFVKMKGYLHLKNLKSEIKIRMFNFTVKPALLYCFQA